MTTLSGAKGQDPQVRGHWCVGEWQLPQGSTTAMTRVFCQSIANLSSCHISRARCTDMAFSRPLLPIKDKHTLVWDSTQATTPAKLTALSAKP